MLWLIKTDFASSRKPHLRNGTPACLLYFRAVNAFLRKRSHLGFQIVAHKIEFVGSLLGGVECDFCRRESEYQPAMTCIDGFESQDFAEKRAVRFGIFTVNNYVRAGKHLPLLEMPGTVNRPHVPRGASKT